MSDERKKDNILLRIIVKVLTAYFVISAIFTAFVTFLIFKFGFGMGWMTAFLAVVGVTIAIAAASHFLPDEEPSLFDLFD